MSIENDANNNDTMILVARFGSIFVLLLLFQIVLGKLSLNPDDREMKRRLQHVLTGHLFVQVSYMNFPVPYMISGLLYAAGMIWYWKNYNYRLYLSILGTFLRVEERRRTSDGGVYPGAYYFLLGAAVPAILYDVPIARYAVECLAIADPMSAWIGQSIPSPQIVSFFIGSNQQQTEPQKATTKTKPIFHLYHSTASVAGCIACFVSSWLVGWFMLPSSSSLYIQITVGAIACTISEAFPVFNDNLSIPFFTGLAVTIVSKLL